MALALVVEFDANDINVTRADWVRAYYAIRDMSRGKPVKSRQLMERLGWSATLACMTMRCAWEHGWLRYADEHAGPQGGYLANDPLPEDASTVTETVIESLRPTQRPMVNVRKPKPTIPRVQRQIMEALWERGELTVREIMAVIRRSCGGNVRSQLKKLERKGWAKHRMEPREHPRVLPKYVYRAARQRPDDLVR